MTHALHIIEPGGRGGVYQHVLGLIQTGAFDNREIIIHTAKDAELNPVLPKSSLCRCMRYQRRGGKRARSAVNFIWASTVLPAHIAVTAVRFPRAQWEIQGLFGSGLFGIYAEILLLLRKRLTFVPHNSFSRSGNRIESAFLKRTVKRASEVVYFVENEREKFPHARSLKYRRLAQYMPPRNPHLEEKLRSHISPSRKLVTFAGQLRMDKDPLILVEASKRLGFDIHLLFAGQDLGMKESIVSACFAANQPVTVYDSYLSLEKFQALLAASDAVVCPYIASSQSGVAALAVQLGVPVIAADVGGLAEQAMYVFSRTGDASRNLAEQISLALSGKPQSDPLTLS